jgi:hypothetical protein
MSGVSLSVLWAPQVSLPLPLLASPPPVRCCSPRPCHAGRHRDAAVPASARRAVHWSPLPLLTLSLPHSCSLRATRPKVKFPVELAVAPRNPLSPGHELPRFGAPKRASFPCTFPPARVGVRVSSPGGFAVAAPVFSAPDDLAPPLHVAGPLRQISRLYSTLVSSYLPHTCS